ncbi:hypothetical protein [Anaerocolumna xylanovorans]|uniref:Uncharacterized protein n=1 Tax=Anaerocolumna xylanovorans DSM 12503 TaxID=1121345 RepID=A0A1M7YFL1_9FIRM|nr:hypothetical protein [Anaerocolumna xylanovorans]SHO51437.1 hypothetical protein SAMN02745217_03192 [Anaerocolumna xylanovorans DSM 12503]
MKMIDQYVYAVTKYLPADSREDVGKELRANIEDMLPDEPTEDEVYQVLKKLGSPIKLADEYIPQKRYLIGPGYYDRYIMTLKTVIGICIVVFISLEMISWISNPEITDSLSGYLAGMISGLISAVLEGAIQGALWVTLVFVILEKTGIESGDIPILNKKWSPDELKDMSVQGNNRITRGETVISLFMTVLFTALLYFKPHLIALYLKGESGNTEIFPLFQSDRLRIYIPVILLFTVLQLGMFIGKFMKGYWNRPLSAANAAYNMASCILIAVMLTDKLLFNQEFFTRMALYLNETPKHYMALWENRIIWVILGIFVVIAVWDSIAVWIKGFGKKG